MFRAANSPGGPKSGSAAVVVLEQTAQALAADSLAFKRADRRLWVDQPVVEPLVVAFGVKVQNEIGKAVPEHLLAEDDHFVETYRTKAHRRGA